MCSPMFTHKIWFCLQRCPVNTPERRFRKTKFDHGFWFQSLGSQNGYVHTSDGSRPHIYSGGHRGVGQRKARTDTTDRRLITVSE